MKIIQYVKSIIHFMLLKPEFKESVLTVIYSYNKLQKNQKLEYDKIN